MERKYGDAFHFEIIAEGNFIDERVDITTIIVRLSCTVLHDWMRSSILDYKYFYETDEEWETYKVEQEASRKEWERF